MERMSPAVSHIMSLVAVALGGAGAGCQQGHAAELDSRVRLLYAGSFTTTVEQPEVETDCGREHVTFESSGYLTLDRATLSARLDGFGCGIDLSSPGGAEFSANAQACVPDGAVNFTGLGIERLAIESFSIDLSDQTTAWRARAWRELPSGRVSYCFGLTGSVQTR
jgi:hypothetical protein